MNKYTFEDVKNFFQNENNASFRTILNNGAALDLKMFIDYAIQDLEKLSKGEDIQPSLQLNDLKGAELISFKLVYFLVSDKYEETKMYAEHWACLLKNYILNFYPESFESIEGLINLLALQNNMARLIALSDYLTFKKETEYKMVPKDFLEAFITE